MASCERTPVVEPDHLGVCRIDEGDSTHCQRDDTDVSTDDDWSLGIHRYAALRTKPERSNRARPLARSAMTTPVESRNLRSSRSPSTTGAFAQDFGNCMRLSNTTETFPPRARTRAASCSLHSDLENVSW